MDQASWTLEAGPSGLSPDHMLFVQRAWRRQRDVQQRLVRSSSQLIKTMLLGHLVRDKQKLERVCARALHLLMPSEFHEDFLAK
eukprot:9087954-Lingulodinium_polyedra.AAC.1